MSGTGRPKSNSVWQYFKYDKETDKSVCVVPSIYLILGYEESRTLQTMILKLQLFVH